MLRNLFLLSLFSFHQQQRNNNSVEEKNEIQAHFSPTPLVYTDAADELEKLAFFAASLIYFFAECTHFTT